MRVQNGDDGTEIGTGRMEPNGQLILSLKPDEQNATKVTSHASAPALRQSKLSWRCWQPPNRRRVAGHAPGDRAACW
jgi:hypothetical protein